MKIKVLSKRAGEPPRSVNIENSLENLQKHVGGYIETVTIAEDAVIICNEEGLLLDLPYNCTICGRPFVGDIIMCGVQGDEFADIPASWDTLKLMFPELWE